MPGVEYPTMSRPALIAAFCVLSIATSSAVGAQPAVAPPHVEGPDIAPVTAPVEVVTALSDERFQCTHSTRTATVQVPDGTWDRIILEAEITPDGDPWDRVFGVAIGGVEVLRGITPRTRYILRRDITEYASLLPPGGTADVALNMGSYVGALLGTVRVEFYADEPTAALVRGLVDEPVGIFTWRRSGGDGTAIEASPRLDAAAPTGATVEITMSGHGPEEFWYLGQRRPRIFRILVDGTEIATATAMPYVYAFLGFGNENANTACVGPGTSTFGDLIHPVMWWSAHRAANAAGVHTGNGEIPPYRAEVAAEHLELLSGSRTIEVVQDGGAGGWHTSLSLLLRR